jgi:hypothetical protein
VTEKIDGAIEEYYTAKLADFNGQKKGVQGWLNEADRLINFELKRLIRKPIKGKWSKKKAIQEVVAEIRKVDRAYQKSVERDVQAYFSLSKVKPLPPTVTEEFYRMVEAAVEDALRFVGP